VVVLIGEKSTTLVIEALINAGMAQHLMPESRTARQRPQRTAPRIVRSETWDAVATTVRRTERCGVIAQEAFLSSEVKLTDRSMRPVTVIDAESLIAASVTRRPDRRMAI